MPIHDCGGISRVRPDGTFSITRALSQSRPPVGQQNRASAPGLHRFHQLGVDRLGVADGVTSEQVGGVRRSDRCDEHCDARAEKLGLHSHPGINLRPNTLSAEGIALPSSLSVTRELQHG